VDIEVKGGERINASVTLQLLGTSGDEVRGRPVSRPGYVVVIITTALGEIQIVVSEEHAPATSRNFLSYVDAGLYNGGRFYRVTRLDNYAPVLPDRPMMEIIQGGLDPSQVSKRSPAIPLERTSVTGIKHVAGTVSMARGAPDSATSEFFILLDDQPSLDFGGKRFADGQGGAAFGHVVSGLDIVRKIQQQPAQGQNLTKSVTIFKIARVK
jgi:peptidyl-prolyl cis-trans isomerase A (cyclophilin A)